MVKFQSVAIKRILKINNSWTESFNFQNSFNCHWLELLRTAPLPELLNKLPRFEYALVLLPLCLFLYFVNKLFLVGHYWDFKRTSSGSFKVSIVVQGKTTLGQNCGKAENFGYNHFLLSQIASYPIKGF